MENKFRIRPAGRHILTIGSELIQDKYAAVIELVKNSYDADSDFVVVTFKTSRKHDFISIIIEDNGTGMSRKTVIDKWLVPSTSDKLDRKVSETKQRIMQGQKGIGRYSASLLGNDFWLETITSEGEKTSVNLNWKNIASADYLDEVIIEINSRKTNLSSGTKITIKGDKDFLEEWNDEEFAKLEYELKKLIPPKIPYMTSDTPDTFEIKLNIVGFNYNDIDNYSVKIEPFPIIDLFDYKISGTIKPDGKGNLIFNNQKSRNTVPEIISFDYGKPSKCGQLFVDIRVYDREPEAIDLLIKRGLKNEKGDYIGKLQARQLLNTNNGIGVYRNNFRIRPLGDPDFDWLKLNERRIQEPSLRIGSNQVIGYISIQSEIISGLKEKSARDGLKENKSYRNLRDIVRKVIEQLEARRFAFRAKEGLSRKVVKVEKELERLFEFDDIKNKIRKKLTIKGIDQKFTDEIIEIITKKEEESNEIAQEISKAVAIYQGQATLGKIIKVVLHEGRRPLNYFKNQFPNMNHWVEKLRETYNLSILNKIVELSEGFAKNGDVLSILFKRLDPLAAGKRGQKKFLNIEHEIEECFKVFENELRTNKIGYVIRCAKKVSFEGWRQDIYAIFTNLIDNSIYWLNENQSSNRLIKVDICANSKGLERIDFFDNGPGIDARYIENDIIFEPEFTTKQEGTGLGLAIAGEAASRNNLKLKALESDNGAYFRLELTQEENNE